MPRKFGVLNGVVVVAVLWGQVCLAWAQVGSSAASALGGLVQSNPFDVARKVWPDRAPLPPPPPVPAAITDADLEVYGVVMSGGAQKALLKLGKRFEGVPVGPTGIAVVPVGGRLGEFVLSQLMPDRILLKAPGGEQWVGFSSKKDRDVPSAGASVSAQSAGAPMGLAGGPSGSSSVAASVTAPVPPGNPFAGVPIAPVGGVNPGGTAGGQVDASPSPAAHPGTLAAAIFAAQAAQKAQANSNAPVTGASGMNPFEALLQQQKK